MGIQRWRLTRFLLYVEAAELARKSGNVNLMNYGAQGHPQRIDLRKLTMTPTRGPRQGRATMLRRVPPTHPGTFMTEAEWQKKQDGEVAKKKEEEEAAKLEAEKQKRLDRLNAMTQCCLAGCKRSSSCQTPLPV